MARDTQELGSLHLIVPGAGKGFADQVCFHAAVGVTGVHCQGVLEAGVERVAGEGRRTPRRAAAAGATARAQALQGLPPAASPPG